MYAAEEDGDTRVSNLPLQSLLELNDHNKLQDAGADHADDFSIQPLLDELGDRWQFRWIKERMKLMWPEINLAARYVTNANCTQRTLPRLRVFT